MHPMDDLIMWQCLEGLHFDWNSFPAFFSGIPWPSGPCHAAFCWNGWGPKRLTLAEAFSTKKMGWNKKSSHATMGKVHPKFFGGLGGRWKLSMLEATHCFFQIFLSWSGIVFAAVLFLGSSWRRCLESLPFDFVQDGPLLTYKWSCSPYKWSYKWIRLDNWVENPYKWSYSPPSNWWRGPLCRGLCGFPRLQGYETTGKFTKKEPPKTGAWKTSC